MRMITVLIAVAGFVGMVSAQGIFGLNGNVNTGGFFSAQISKERSDVKQSVKDLAFNVKDTVVDFKVNLLRVLADGISNINSKKQSWKSSFKSQQTPEVATDSRTVRHSSAGYNTGYGSSYGTATNPEVAYPARTRDPVTSSTGYGVTGAGHTAPGTGYSSSTYSAGGNLAPRLTPGYSARYVKTVEIGKGINGRVTRAGVQSYQG